MSKIKAGDWVVVDRPSFCCNNHESIGLFFKVSWVGQVDDVCLDCGYSSDRTVLGADDDPDEDTAFDMRRLRRIDPPTEGEYDGVPVRRKVPRKEMA